jgi:integrase
MARIYLEPLTWPEATALLGAAFEHYQITGYHIPYLYILNGLHTAFRLKDLMSMKWGDYELHESSGRICKIETKTGKLREVPIMGDYFTRIITVMSELQPDPDHYIHGPMTRQSINAWLKKLALVAGIKKTVASHSLRKAWAMRIFNRSGRTEEALIQLSVALNHSDVAQTRTYIGLSRNSEAINNLYKLI